MKAAVLLHVPTSSHSSVAAGYSELAARMSARGDALEIITPADLWPGLNPRLNPLLLPIAARRWLRRRRDLDLVMFHSYLGWLAPHSPGRPRLVTCFHGLEPLYHQALAMETSRRGKRLSRRYALMYGPLMTRMLKRACRRSDLVICLNAQERDLLVSGGYADAGRVAVAWHDAPRDFFRPHRYRPRTETLLCVMQWLPTKGTRYLVEAFAEIARARADLRLVIAGTLIPAPDVLTAFPEDVRARVTAVPVFNPAQQRELLARADLFVHPSLSEGFSRAVIEALAAGVPVITTRTGFAVDGLSDDADALVVPVADSAALTAAIRRLLDDQTARMRLGRAGQAHAARLRQADGTGTLQMWLARLVDDRGVALTRTFD